MSRSLCVFCVLLSALAGSNAAATDLTILPPNLPTVLQQYRVLPRFSTVLETGGFAGVSNRYRVNGGFQVSFGPEYGYDPIPLPYDGTIGTPDSDPNADLSNVTSLPLPDSYPFPGPTLGFGSEFVRAELWGRPISGGPVIQSLLDVDEAFNLTELEGQLAPTFNPRFDLYTYSGRTDDGSSVRLKAAVAGDWFYMVGATIAPPGSADFLKYRIRSLARLTPFDGTNAAVSESLVNAADYAVLRDTAGDLFEWQNGVSGDGLDLSIFDLLEADLGGVAVSAVTVPEPAAAALLVLGVAAFARRRRV